LWVRLQHVLADATNEIVKVVVTPIGHCLFDNQLFRQRGNHGAHVPARVFAAHDCDCVPPVLLPIFEKVLEQSSCKPIASASRPARTAAMAESKFHSTSAARRER
jgi:hypothetical protein